MLLLRACLQGKAYRRGIRDAVSAWTKVFLWFFVYIIIIRVQKSFRYRFRFLWIYLWNLCDLYPTIRVICASKNKSHKPIKHNFQQQSAPSRFTRIAQTKTNQTSLRNSAFSPIFAKPLILSLLRRHLFFSARKCPISLLLSTKKCPFLQEKRPLSKLKRPLSVKKAALTGNLSGLCRNLSGPCRN